MPPRIPVAGGPSRSIMLNAIGLDLNVDNDGPCKGAEVTWTGTHIYERDLRR
jgi:hypothetical protein